jgi:hypothetical protein
MNESAARVIAQPEKTSRVLWDANDQVANRLREIRDMANMIQNRIEYGDFVGATRIAIGIKRLTKEALELRAKRNRR